MSRGNNRQDSFRKPEDFAAFVQLLIDGKRHAAIDLLGYCLMNDHWHLVVRPRGDRDLSRYLAWVTNTHVKRYRAHYRRSSGHLYHVIGRPKPATSGRAKAYASGEAPHLFYIGAGGVIHTLRT